MLAISIGAFSYDWTLTVMDIVNPEDALYVA